MLSKYRDRPFPKRQPSNFRNPRTRLNIWHSLSPLASPRNDRLFSSFSFFFFFYPVFRLRILFPPQFSILNSPTYRLFTGLVRILFLASPSPLSCFNFRREADLGLVVFCCRPTCTPASSVDTEPSTLTTCG
jgi:hypothetical protein